MKHQHDVNLNLPEEFQRAKQHVQENKKPYLYACVGLMVGLAIGRRRTPETTTVVVVTELDRPSTVSYF